MTRGIGGYVRRSERRYVPPAGDDMPSGPNWLRHSVLPSGAVMTWRIEPPQFQTPLSPLRFEAFDVPDEPGPPYVHTFSAPEPIGHLDDGTPIYPPPGPPYTLTETP